MKEKVLKLTIPMIILTTVIVAILYARSCNKPLYNFDTNKITISKYENGEFTKVQDITDKSEITKLIKILKGSDLSKNVLNTQMNDSSYECCIAINNETIIALKKDSTHGCISDVFGKGIAIYLPKEFCDYINKIIQIHRNP